MSGDFYVTLFSNTSQDLFPDNSTSKFTVKLPKAISIPHNENWKCGLVECSHPRIMGTINGPGAQDEIIFQSAPDESLYYTSVLGNFIIFVLENTNYVSLYTKRYFQDFLDLDNLKEFTVNEKMLRHKTEIQPGEQAFKVAFYPAAFQFRTAEEPVKDYFVFVIGKPYTMREILWTVLNTYYKILNEGEITKEILIKHGILFENKTTSEMLLIYAKTFVNVLHQLLSTQGLNRKISNFLLMYTDIVESQIVGNSISKLLYATPRNADVDKDQILIRNTKYLPLCKSFIEDISFYFADEAGHQIVFESGFLPAYVVLHFKRA